jgi:hypothetical protein
MLAGAEKAAMLISSHRLGGGRLVNRVIELDQGRVVLDDRFADLVDLSRLACTCGSPEPTRRSPAIAGWVPPARGFVWQGRVAGPDLLRFLGLLSLTLLSSIHRMRSRRNINASGFGDFRRCPFEPVLRRRVGLQPDSDIRRNREVRVGLKSDPLGTALSREPRAVGPPR